MDFGRGVLLSRDECGIFDEETGEVKRGQLWKTWISVEAMM